MRRSSSSLSCLALALVSAAALSGCDVCIAAQDREECLAYNYEDVYQRSESPAVALVGDTAVAVYRSFESPGTASQLMVATIAMYGDPAIATRSLGQPTAFAPSIGSSGDAALIAWKTPDALQWMRVDAGGERLDAGGSIAVDLGRYDPVDITFTGAYYAVAWYDGSARQIGMAAIDADTGALVSQTALDPIEGPFTFQSVSVAGRPDGGSMLFFLVADGSVEPSPGTLYGVRFDAAGQAVDETPIALDQGLSWTGEAVVDDTGRALLFAGDVTGDRSLALALAVDLDAGTSERLPLAQDLPSSQLGYLIFDGEDVVTFGYDANDEPLMTWFPQGPEGPAMVAGIPLPYGTTGGRDLTGAYGRFITVYGVTGVGMVANRFTAQGTVESYRLVIDEDEFLETRRR